ncbi:YtxH domain-containing protein [Thomasclavelia sp.]
MKIGKFIAGIGIGTVIGMLLAPKKGSELREDLKEKSQELYDKAQNMTKEDFEDLINNTIEEIKLAIDEFDVEEFKESTGTKLAEVKVKLEQLASSVKSSDEYANFKASVAKVSSDLTNKLDEIKTKIQDKDFDAIKELDDAMDDIEDELDVIIEDLKD